MPTLNRQKPVAANGQPISGKPGSVLAKAIPVSNLKDSFVKFLLYGGNGIGKTTLACSFEKPLLLIALERSESGGARSVRRVPGVNVLKPGWPAQVPWDAPDVILKAEDVIADMENLGEELKVKNPFKTVVFDHVTVFQDWVLETLVGHRLPEQLNFGTVSGDTYRDRAERTKTLLRPWVDMRCHTIFIGKEKDHNPPKEEKVNERTGKVQPDMRPKFLRGMQQESFISVDLGGAAVGWLSDACEFIGRLYMDREIERKVNKLSGGQEHVQYVETGKFVRALRIAYHPNYAARFRSDLPDSLPEAIPNPTYGKIKAAIDGTYKEKQ